MRAGIRNAQIGVPRRQIGPCNYLGTLLLSARKPLRPNTALQAAESEVECLRPLCCAPQNKHAANFVVKAVIVDQRVQYRN